MNCRAFFSGFVLMLGATAALVSTPAPAVSTVDQQYSQALRLKPSTMHGAELFELCASCHGRDGAGTPDGAVPAIAGQYAPVLVKQVIEFRADARHSIRVQGFLSHHQLTSQDLADVAAYVSRLPPRLPSASHATSQTAHGAALYASLCAGCHGANADGNAGTRVPRLAGQHPEYLAEQLRDTAAKGRPSMQPEHASLLAQLSVDDMNDLALYIAQIAPATRGR